MRICLATFVLLAAAAAACAADLRPPDDLPHYDFAINLDVANHRVLVTQQATWTNTTGKPIDQLVFNVHSHFTPPKTPKEVDQYAKLLEIFRIPASEAVFFREAFQLEKVESLKKVGDDWQRAELKHQWNKDLATALIVALPEPLPPGQSTTVALTYTMELPEKQGRWGQFKGVTFLTNWHPVFAVYEADKGWQPTPFIPWHQPWYNEAGVFTARIRVPKDQQVASTGSIARIEDGAETKDVFIGPVTARDFALLASARYTEFVGEAKNGTGKPVRIRCMAFPEHEHYAQSLIKHASRAIENYAQWFGPFPYPEFTIAESYFGWNGNECGGLVMIDERVFSMPHFADGYVQYLISHETCHQWFYNAVGTNGYKETFMDEAIVTHLSHRLVDEFEGTKNDLLNYPPELAFLPGIKRENYRHSQFYGVIRNKELMPAVQDMEKYGSVIGLFAAVYDRGSKVVGMIEDRLGTTAFHEFLRRIYTKYYFRIIRVADFQRELEEYTGRKWDVFFKDWLGTAGMSDWAVDAVTGVSERAANGPAGAYRATVILSQRAEISEATTLGFSFDKGATYPIRVPVSMPQRMSKDEREPGKAPFGDGPEVHCERLDDKHIRVQVDLPGPPDQVTVDPDQVLPDADPSNNFWDMPINYRPRPLYTFIDETNYTNDYDRWNVIYGPWFYGAFYSEGWFTRSTILGLRGGLYRNEEFRGGVYTGYRPTFGDWAVGFDGVLPHVPDAKWEIGAHGEASIGRILPSQGYNPDRGTVWLRNILEPTSSMYLNPREYVEGYTAIQYNWMPTPRHPTDAGIGINPLTTVGYHYRKDTRTPYWDPDNGILVDANLAGGVPLFGENHWSGLAWGQASYTMGLPGELGWWSDVKLAFRVGGAVALPKNARLYTLGGNEWFRGFDVFERQGNCMWLGSVEVRIPVKKDIDFDVADHLVRLRSLTLAPFYDVGDIYLDSHSLGPVAHAVGLGVRAQVDFFSFLERATMRFDIGQSIGQHIKPQFWIGVEQPF